MDKTMTDPYIPSVRKKKVQTKCSNCADKRCPFRGSVVDWLHCDKWMPEGVENDAK